jgi:hypothetical protein
MKALTLLIWLSWVSICVRVLLAPAFRLTLAEALVWLLACAPAVGFLCWARRVLCPSSEAKRPESPDKGAAVPHRPRRRRTTQKAQVAQQVF